MDNVEDIRNEFAWKLDMQDFEKDKWQKKFDIRWENHQYDFIKILCDSERAFWKDKKLCLTAKGMLVADKITVELMCQRHS